MSLWRKLKSCKMKQKLIILVLFVCLLPIVNSQVNDKSITSTGKQFGKEFLIGQVLEKTNVTNIIGGAVSDSNPQLYEEVKSFCNKSKGVRNFFWILGILGLLGMVTIHPASSLFSVIGLFGYLNYACLI